MTPDDDTPAHRQTVLIEALRDPRRYDHAVTRLQVLETHISWVILTGPYAYKIKKPIDLGFADFHTLELRRFYCEEELRLNRRLAPQLYLDVWAITGCYQDPTLGGDGEVIEYAVRMRQFPHDARLDHQLEAGRLDSAQLEAAVRRIADFHARAPATDADRPFGRPETVWKPIQGNFDTLLQLDIDADERHRLDALAAWSRRRHRELTPLIEERRDAGHVRECHGDLHLGNMALIDERIVAFDCIEFNETLRWIDVINELAFLCMDLDYRERPDLAHHVCNTYLEHSGEYGGLPLLAFYRTYRALVRAKVAAIRRSQDDLDERERAAVEDDVHRHLALAESYTRPSRSAIVIAHGLSGSGKTSLTEPLVGTLGMIRIRSDVERKRLHGLAPGARTGSEVDDGIYGTDTTDATYARLIELAEGVVGAGHAAILDATFLRREHRDRARSLARRLDVPFVILDMRAERAALEARIRRRERTERDASEAGLEVLAHQLATLEPLGADEAPDRIPVDTEHVDPVTLPERVRAHLGWD